MDSSRSVKDNWNDTKSFVNKISRSLNISVNGSHVAVTVFSNLAHLKVAFSEYYTYFDQSPQVDSFKEAVDTLSFLDGNTRIHNGLEVAYERMFQKANGMRSSAPKFLVLITDGQEDADNLSLIHI